MNIRTTITTLSDGSECYDIDITQDDHMIRLHAVSETDAADLVAKLTDAIHLHTVDTATVENW